MDQEEQEELMLALPAETTAKAGYWMLASPAEALA
jgi:hypothetical protein